MIASRAPRANVRSVVVLTAVALATPVLAGCGLQSGDETSKARSQIQAANATIGGIQIRNAFIASLPTASTPGPGEARSYLVVTLINNGQAPDRLTGISTGLGVAQINTHGEGAAASTPTVTLPLGIPVQVSNPEINPEAPSLEIEGNPPVVGTTELVSFTFENAGTTGQIPVPVVHPGGSLSPTQVIPTDQATFSAPAE